MDILLYLTELLESRKSVGITGLGTLYKKKSPGRYDAAQHAFLPPSYQLSFTTEINDQDAEELSQYISDKRNISSDSANYYIGEFAAAIQGQLADQYEASLGDLGTLKLVNDELVLVDVQEKFGNGSFGLPVVQELTAKTEGVPNALEEMAIEQKVEEENPGEESFEPIFHQDEQPTHEEIAEVSFESPAEEKYWEQPSPAAIEHQHELVPSPISEEFSSENTTIDDQNPDLAAGQTIPVDSRKTEAFDEKQWAKNIAHPDHNNSRRYFDAEDEEEPPRRRSVFIKFLIVLFFIAIAGALLYFFFPAFFDQYLDRFHEPAPAADVRNPTLDSLKLKADSARIDSMAKSNEVYPTYDDLPVVDTTKTYYEVIGTTENTVAAAEKYIDRVSKVGVHAKQIKLAKKKFTVSVGTFSDQMAANKFRDSVRIKLKNKQIYVKTIKPKTHTN
ncbi:MAG: SPOR domain-containing protein [Pedobacter sp.]|nr:SPOR domain-containing protein [Pedobacter sp.]MDQ8053834.1 SPOR domain-containing protein [Pedobacter sp.]